MLLMAHEMDDEEEDERGGSGWSKQEQAGSSKSKQATREDGSRGVQGVQAGASSRHHYGYDDDEDDDGGRSAGGDRGRGFDDNEDQWLSGTDSYKQRWDFTHRMPHVG